MQPNTQPAPALDAIAKRIFEIRGQRVMLDSDLAVLYGVETKYLVKATKRNIERFPEDFMFQLSEEEWGILRCQIGTSSWGAANAVSFGIKCSNFSYIY